MFKKHFQTIFALLFFILVTSLITSTALSGTAFGPKQYQRTSGSPNTYTDTFQATGENRILAIKNGDAGGNNRVTSAVVYLNGKEIFGPGDFKESVYAMEKAVDLNNGTNTLKVVLSSKPGSYITIEATGNVADSPTVTISANPASINSGASSTLTWSSTNATSCSINQGIGTVATSGSINIAPTQTTTYTITATGVGGTVTANAKVTVTQPPTVTIAANPASINPGASSTLTWSSTNATSCSINQGIGTVATSGSKKVAPAQTTTYTITASGPGGTTQAAITVIVSTASKIDLTITSPANGASVTGSSVMVTGTVNNSLGYETGVTVNGAVATVSNNTFVANHVPLIVGTNTITVTAVDAKGTSATQSITVNAIAPANYINISASLESGIAPLIVVLRINGSFSIDNPAITSNGPGAVQQLDNTNSGEYSYQLNTEGVYYFTAQVTGPDGNTYQDTIAITVLSLAQVDALLQSKWSAMSNALQSGNTTAALNLIHTSKQANYQTMFNVLQNQLPSIMATQTGLVFNSMINANTAWYDLTTAETGGNFVYRVVFVKDTNGLWCILSF